MSSSGQVRAGGAYVEIGGDDKQLNAALARIGAKFNAMGSVVSAAGRKMIAIGTAIAAPFVIAGKTFAEVGDRLYRAAQRTGVQVEALSELGYAAQQSGTDMETLELSIRKMQKALGGGGSGQASKALQEMGLSFQDLAGLSPDAQLKKIADGLNHIQDPALQSAAAMELFGRNGTQMLPFLQQGSEGIEMMQKRARSLGLTMSTDAARGAAVFKQQLNDVTDVLKNSLVRAGEAVAPMLTRIVNGMTRAAVTANQWVSSHKEIVQTALKVGAGIAAAGVAFVVFGKGLGIAASAVSGIGSVFTGLTSVAGLLASGLTAMASVPVLVGVALVAMAAYMAYSTETGRDMLTALGGYFGDLKDTALAAFGGIKDALAAGDWQLAAQIAWAGLKLAWTQGIAPLKQAWTDFKFGFMETAYTAFYGVQEIWDTVRSALTVAWIETTSYIGGVWRAMVSVIRDAWDAVANFLQKSWNNLKGVFSSKFDAKTANAAVDTAADAARAERDKQLLTDAQRAEAARSDAREDERKRHNSKMLELDGQHQAASAENAKAAGDAEAQDAEALEKRKQDLRSKTAKAKDEKDKKKDSAPLPLLKTPNLPNGDEVNGMMSKVKSVGTFSAAGAFGLSASGPAQRTANAVEKIAKHAEKQTKSLEDIAKKGPGTFS